MAFTVSDVRDLLRVLRENPEWKEEVRRELLGEEILSLPALVRQNSEAIDRLAEQMTRSEARLEGVEARLEGVEARLEGVETRLEGVEARLEGVETRLGGVETRLEGVETGLQALRSDFGVLAADVGQLKGYALEARFRERADGIFGRWIRRVKVVKPRDLAAFEAADDAGRISEAEAHAVRLLDLIVTGRRGRGDDAEEVMFAVEVSSTIDNGDVTRAADRAEILSGLGYPAEPVAAGNTASEAVIGLARERGVFLVVDPQTP